MEEKLRKVENLLKKYGQEELLNYNIEYTEELLDEILSIDFEQLKELYEKAIKKEEIIANKIEPIKYIDKEKLSEAEIDKYQRTGENIIKNGQYAVVTMAGGQRNKVRT